MSQPLTFLASQPAALFVDQKIDNKSVYHHALLLPSSSFSFTFFIHSLLFLKHPLVCTPPSWFSFLTPYLSYYINTQVNFISCRRNHLAAVPFLIVAFFKPRCHLFCSHFSVCLFLPLTLLSSPTPPSHGVAVPVALVFTSPAVWCVGTSVSAASVSNTEFVSV